MIFKQSYVNYLNTAFCQTLYKQVTTQELKNRSSSKVNMSDHCGRLINSIILSYKIRNIKINDNEIKNK